MKWDDLNAERRFFGWQAYSMSKLANILHAKELAHRLENTGISVYVLHPGKYT
jgi:NAD(P)-dependent dehydrogenase (short-subunit alcohol dehydrogenase family)